MSFAKRQVELIRLCLVPTTLLAFGKILSVSNAWK